MSSKQKQVMVRFYRAERATTDGPWPKDGNIEQHLRRKLVQAPSDPYIPLTDGTFIIESHANQSGVPLHFSISTVRHDNLPLRERHGHTDALELPDDENLAEQAHVVVFASGVVGIVRGLASPGHLKSSTILSYRAEVDITFVPILRPEIEALLTNSIGVVNLDFRVAGNSFDALAADGGDPVEAVQRLTSQFSGAGEAALHFRATNGPNQQRFRSWLLRNLEAIVGNRDVKGAKATVIDRDFERHVVNLLQDQIGLTIPIATRSNSRSLDPDSARSAITDAYNEQIGVITRALEQHGE